MKLINPILFFLLLIFTLLNISDAITAMFILPGESNPIFLLFGSMWPVLLLKFGVNLGAWYYYKRNIYNSNLTYYMILIVLILGTLLIGLGVASNIYGILNPAVIEAGKQLSTGEKTTYYFSYMGLLYFLPLLFGIVAFVLYDKSRHRVVVDKQYFKKKPWWKRW